MIVGLTRVGRYEIERHVASGGMAEVYQARDPESGERVALKIPHDGEEIWEAERTGAALQIELSRRDRRVPHVFAIGAGDERFVAMEYVEGEDLSRRLQAGPLDWREATALAIELCGVLATARSCCAPDGEPGGIVHGDIKPRNIRIESGGRIKVLDFGIAKALRQTRDETRNLYGSVPYSSPERLDRGHVDYHSDLWSVAVVLYEMLEGLRPFRAANDADLERTIRSGARPAPLEREVPAAFAAILARAFAPALGERYASAEEMAGDLRAVLAAADGVPAASGPGATGSTPDAAPDAPPDAGRDATRRTHALVNGHDATRRSAGAATAPDLDATRRTGSGTATRADVTRRSEGTMATADATRRTTAVPTAPAEAPPASAQPAPSARATRPRWWGWRTLAVLVALLLAGREFRAFGAAGDLHASLASRPRGEAGAVWGEYRRVARGGMLVPISGIGGAVRDWLVAHADDLISRYRSDTPAIGETGWRAAEALLQRASRIDPGDRRIQARLEFCRAHLLRIAARDARPGEESMSRYDEAVSRFERAARLRPVWGDPYVGLAQIQAYGKRDPERTAEAIERARRARYPLGERETALLGDAYRLRAERRWAASTDAFDREQHYRHLERVREDCVAAIEQYEQVPAYAGVSRHLRALRQRLGQIEARQSTLTSGSAIERALRWLVTDDDS